MIKDIEVNNRPREKAFMEGFDKLSDSELLAIIIGSGTKNNSALDIAKELLNRFNGLNNMLNCDLYSLMKIKGIKKVKAIQIMTVLELAKRAHKEKKRFIRCVRNCNDAYDVAKDDLENSKQEKFMVIYLNIRLNIIKKEILFVGGDSTSYVDINLILKKAIECGSKNIICLHNHPSGDPTPSKEDIAITQSIVKMASILKIKLIDHIIIGKGEYVSLKRLNVY